MCVMFFFVKQKTAYEMRISDWSSDVCSSDLFVLPEVQIDDEVATLPGLDGRKMSKSYDNTIPLFEGGAKGLRAAVMRIVTDSRQPGEPKDAEGSHLYTLYRAFATPAERSEARRVGKECVSQCRSRGCQD